MADISSNPPVKTSTLHQETIFLISFFASIGFLCLVICTTICCSTCIIIFLKKKKKANVETQQNNFDGEEYEPLMAVNDYSDDDDAPINIRKSDPITPSAPPVPFAEPTTVPMHVPTKLNNPFIH